MTIFFRYLCLNCPTHEEGKTKVQIYIDEKLYSLNSFNKKLGSLNPLN